MEEKAYPQTWYVYTYAYPVDMGGAIFYAGKGTGTRMFAHEMEARGGCQCAKCDIIRSIWTSGKTAQKSIVFETFVEAEAYQHESELITKYAATLTNVLGIPEEVRKERNLKEAEKRMDRYPKKEIDRFFALKDTPSIPGKTRYVSPWTEIYGRLETAYEYCQLGPGAFIHYSELFGLEQHPEGKISGYREADLIAFNVWMQENYPRVGAARRELLEREREGKKRDAEYMAMEAEYRALHPRGF